jgi:hypothetical protein
MIAPLSNALESCGTQKQRLFSFFATIRHNKIHWATVLKLPTYIVLMTAVGGFSVVADTFRIDGETVRLATDTDQFVTDVLMARSLIHTSIPSMAPQGRGNVVLPPMRP